ncbi:MAG: class I SAM-dependent methyltransferase [Actinomycetota bacterium]
MDPDIADLSSYYEAEAAAEVRGEPTGRRVELRDAFVQRLLRDGCSSVVDLGAGPATDGAAFADRGLHYVGLDLAIGNGHLARRRDLTVVPGSLDRLPFRSHSFDAGYSMSALQHIPDRLIGAVLDEIRRILRPGAPVGIGLWGGPDDEVHGEWGKVDGRRLFRLRTDDHVRTLLGEHLGAVESFETFGDPADTGWWYQFVSLTSR